jgi:hypothetical protein
LASLFEFGTQGLIHSLEGQDGRHAGQIEAVLEEPPDLSEPDQVVVAVATGAALAASWVDQPPSFVEPKILGSVSHQFGGYGDPVEAMAPIGTLIGPRRLLVPRRSCKTTCIGHGLQGIKNLK